MKSELMWRFLKRLLTAPTFPDKDRTLAARWLNLLLLSLVVLLLADSIGIILGILDQHYLVPLLISNTIGVVISLSMLLVIRRGYVKSVGLLLLAMLFFFATYTNAVVFRTMRTPAVMTYFALIPLAGLLLGRRSMNIFATICVMVISITFYFEWVGLLIPSSNTRSIFDDLFVLFLTIAVNTILLNASIRRVEEESEETRQTAIALAMANRELQSSQVQLQQAQAELEQRVERRTEELRQSNIKLQAEIIERQRVLDALRKSEANWRSLAEYLPESIATINYDYTIAFINRSINHRAPENLIGLHASILHTQPQYQALLEEKMISVFQTGETASYESEETTEKGPAWYINRVGVIKQDEQAMALILISTDITEQKQNEAAIYHTQKLESLGILAGGVAHDFNNLLTAMLLQMSSALAKSPPDHPTRPHIQRTIKAAERATELTRQMLNYSGRSPSETKPMDLNDLIMDNIHLFSSAIPKTVILDSKLSSDIPLMMGDKGQIQQLIMNLILNSADAIGQKAGHITVVTDTDELTTEETRNWQRAGSTLTSGRYVRLEVSDTGSGMDAKTLTKIFDPFFTTKFTGRGLGLASVLGIIRAHHGGLDVTSIIGEGTKFTILFPAMPEAPHLLAEIPNEALTTLDDALVLVIDDEAMVREAMVDILITAGLQVLQAADGPSGIQLFRERRQEIKLVLLDLSMPGMNGQEVFSELRKLDSQIPVLLISGYSEHDIMDRFVNQGLAGFIQKPYTIDSLLQQIKPYLYHTDYQTNDLVRTASAY